VLQACCTCALLLWLSYSACMHAVLVSCSVNQTFMLCLVPVNLHAVLCLATLAIMLCLCSASHTSMLCTCPATLAFIICSHACCAHVLFVYQTFMLCLCPANLTFMPCCTLLVWPSCSACGLQAILLNSTVNVLATLAFILCLHACCACALLT
jgi:hypothetical protein